MLERFEILDGRKQGKKNLVRKEKVRKVYPTSTMHFLVSVMFQSFLTISVYVIFNIITITKYCVIVNRKTLKIVLYHKSFFLFSFFYFLAWKIVNRFLFDLQVIKIQKEWGNSREIWGHFFSSSKIRGISFLLGEITLQDNSKHLLLVTHSCCVGGVGV